jgi:hypothetical protein
MKEKHCYMTANSAEYLKKNRLTHGLSVSVVAFTFATATTLTPWPALLGLHSARRRSGGDLKSATQGDVRHGLRPREVSDHQAQQVFCQGVFTTQANPKYFLFHPSHQIFRIF